MSRADVGLDRIFRALASEPRREILRRVAIERRTVTELAEHFDMSLAAVAKHVHVLVSAQLLDYVQEGRVHWCRMNPVALDPAFTLLGELRAFWDRRMDRLQQVLETPAGRPPPGAGRKAGGR